MTGSEKKLGYVYEAFDEILADLKSKSKAECILLVDITGQLVSRKGALKDGNPTQVAALVAGDMAAMAEISKQIGDSSQPLTYLHEGEEKSLFLSNIDNILILLVVFGNETPVGMIRLLSRFAVEKLEGFTEKYQESRGSSAGIDRDKFQAGLSDQLTEAFMDE